MILWIIDWLQSLHHGFGVLNYVTLRAVLSALTSLGLVLIFGKSFISYLIKSQISQIVREEGPSSHYSKRGTPTMGGALIIFSIIFSLLLWGNLSNRYLLIAMLTCILFGAIGWVDDYMKLILKHPKGLPARWKYFLQSVFALMIAIFLYMHATSPAETNLLLPFFKEAVIPLGAFYIILTYFVIVGTSNAVNLTDGLDGLAIMPIILVGGALGVFAYVTGHINFAEYLYIPFINGTGELTVFCAAIVGSGLGFLWFNSYPAQVFMGDVGSLGLGATLGVLAVMVRQELVLFIMGGVFVAETISVILQISSFKLRGTRIFKMAPVHHHFELVGWPEPKVIVRFWIITFVLVLLGLASLKIR